MPPNTSDDRSREQDELEDRDRTASGGDAEAAGSVDERRAVAADEDDLFEDESADDQSDE